MSKPIIETHCLSKAYRLPRSRWWRKDQATDTIWSLKDVTFRIGEGEIWGVIGRNGAGKSTLLKILAQITEPTSGRAVVRGKVASLLEIGTGFHPELSGRENVYLNGALLGMRRSEIARKFSDIVDFSEIGHFIDVPVKRYSSGMYVRLAFSVAAHLDSDILLIDEVLAVGDYSFQQRCLKKTLDLAGSGRTVLFVSHNLGIISRLCQQALFLEKGCLMQTGSTPEVMQSYLTQYLKERCELQLPAVPEKPVQLNRVTLVGASNNESRYDIAYHEGFYLQVEYTVREPMRHVAIGVNLGAFDGTAIFASSDLDCDHTRLETREPGTYRTRVAVPGRWLNTGRYLLQAHITNSHTATVYDSVDALMFNIVETDTPASTQGIRKRLGVLQPILQWQVERAELS